MDFVDLDKVLDEFEEEEKQALCIIPGQELRPSGYLEFLEKHKEQDWALLNPNRFSSTSGYTLERRSARKPINVAYDDPYDSASRYKLSFMASNQHNSLPLSSNISSPQRNARRSNSAIVTSLTRISTNGNDVNSVYTNAATVQERKGIANCSARKGTIACQAIEVQTDALSPGSERELLSLPFPKTDIIVERLCDSNVASRELVAPFVSLSGNEVDRNHNPVHASAVTSNIVNRGLVNQYSAVPSVSRNHEEEETLPNLSSAFNLRSVLVNSWDKVCVLSSSSSSISNSESQCNSYLTADEAESEWVSTTDQLVNSASANLILDDSDSVASMCQRELDEMRIRNVATSDVVHNSRSFPCRSQGEAHHVPCLDSQISVKSQMSETEIAQYFSPHLKSWPGNLSLCLASTSSDAESHSHDVNMVSSDVESQNQDVNMIISSDGESHNHDVNLVSSSDAESLNFDVKMLPRISVSQTAPIDSTSYFEPCVTVFAQISSSDRNISYNEAIDRITSYNEFDNIVISYKELVDRTTDINTYDKDSSESNICCVGYNESSTSCIQPSDSSVSCVQSIGKPFVMLSNRQVHNTSINYQTESEAGNSEDVKSKPVSYNINEYVLQEDTVTEPSLDDDVVLKQQMMLEMYHSMMAQSSEDTDHLDPHNIHYEIQSSEDTDHLDPHNIHYDIQSSEDTDHLDPHNIHYDIQSPEDTDCLNPCYNYSDSESSKNSDYLNPCHMPENTDHLNQHDIHPDDQLAKNTDTLNPQGIYPYDQLAKNTDPFNPQDIHPYDQLAKNTDTLNPQDIYPDVQSSRNTDPLNQQDVHPDVQSFENTDPLNPHDINPDDQLAKNTDPLYPHDINHEVQSFENTDPLNQHEIHLDVQSSENTDLLNLPNVFPDVQFVENTDHLKPHDINHDIQSSETTDPLTTHHINHDITYWVDNSAAKLVEKSTSESDTNSVSPDPISCNETKGSVISLVSDVRPKISLTINKKNRPSTLLGLSKVSCDFQAFTKPMMLLNTGFAVVGNPLMVNVGDVSDNNRAKVNSEDVLVCDEAMGNVGDALVSNEVVGNLGNALVSNQTMVNTGDTADGSLTMDTVDKFSIAAVDSQKEQPDSLLSHSRVFNSLTFNRAASTFVSDSTAIAGSSSQNYTSQTLTGIQLEQGTTELIVEPGGNNTSPIIRSERIKRPTSLNLPLRPEATAGYRNEDTVSIKEQEKAAERKDEQRKQTNPGSSTSDDISLPYDYSVMPNNLGLVAPFWIPDANAPTCMNCSARFTIWKRRHHCRACGKVLCASCCNQKAVLHYMDNKEARVCIECHIQLSLVQQKYSNEPKQVNFYDGIQPGSDLPESEGSKHIPPDHEPAKKVQDPVSKKPKQQTSQHVLKFKEDSLSRSYSLIPEDGLPPLDALPNENAEDGSSVMFSINRNLLVGVKIVNLDCCMNKVYWCYVTRGMDTAGQRELVVLLELTEEELVDPSLGPPRDVFVHFQAIYEDALAGNIIQEMGHYVFHQSNTGNLMDSGGFLFLQPTYQCLMKIPLPECPYLFGVLIKKQEVPWARVFPIRLMLRLGAESRYYPCPVASAATRKSVFYDIGHTIINLLADFHSYQYTLPQIKGATISMEKRKTVICFPKYQYNYVMKALLSSNEHVMSFGSCFNSEVDSHLVCIQTEDGNYQTQAINIQNKPILVTGASFIVFNGALKSSSGLRAKYSIVEDGLMVQVLPEVLASIKEALKNMADYMIQCGPIGADKSEGTVELRWVDNCFNNTGEKSHIDGTSLEGAEIIHIKHPSDYLSESLGIRWVQVYVLEKHKQASTDHSCQHMHQLMEGIAHACCTALVNHLDELKKEDSVKLGLRVNLTSESISYDIGAKGHSLSVAMLNNLDTFLVPVIHQASNKGVILEFIFHIVQ